MRFGFLRPAFDPACVEAGVLASRVTPSQRYAVASGVRQLAAALDGSQGSSSEFLLPKYRTSRTVKTAASSDTPKELLGAKHVFSP